MRLLTSCVVLVIIGVQVSFATVPTQNWNDIVTTAIRQNPELLAAKESLKQAEANLVISRSAQYPQVSLSSTVTDGESGSYGLTGRQLLFDGFKTSAEIKQSKWLLNAAFDQYHLDSSRIRFDLRTAFVSLLKNQELLKIAQEISKRRLQNFELVSLRYEAGREHKGALMTAKANLAQAEFEEEQASKNIYIEQLKLSRALGEFPLRPVVIRGDFVPIELPADTPDFSATAKENPEWLRRVHQEKAAEAGIAIARAKYFPELNGSLSTAKSFDDGLPGQNDWTLSAGLSLSILDGGSRKGSTDRATSIFRESVYSAKDGLSVVIISLETSWKEVQDSLQQVDVQKQFFEAAKERSKIAGAQYSTGLISFDNWTIIEDNLVRTQKSYIQSIATSMIAEANYVFAKGGTLEHYQ